MSKTEKPWEPIATAPEGVVVETKIDGGRSRVSERDHAQAERATLVFPRRVDVRVLPADALEAVGRMTTARVWWKVERLKTRDFSPLVKRRVMRLFPALWLQVETMRWVVEEQWPEERHR